MYSPKIDETLIPHLYRWRQELGIPMTRLVNGILSHAVQGWLDPQPVCICARDARSVCFPGEEATSHATGN